MKTLLKILILTTLFIGTKLYAQELTRKNLISQLKADKEPLFVINGIPFSYSDSLKLDVELKRIDKNKISEITILKNEGKISHQRNDVIIIQYAFKLSKKVIKEKLIEIKTKFTDKYHGFSQHIYTDAKDSVLYLNGNRIHHTEINNLIHNLKINNIGYIYLSQTPQSQEYHGQNAKNGIVLIWTNDKLTE
ncbi:MAG: hypothetical protein EOO47_16330 [Flavobacterium sp.]|nr:MAG: hypothetical protein EOO47_16330 [Flavobacterium sp.]